MQLRWTKDAATDLERIADYLVQHAPERAAELVRTVYEECSTKSGSQAGSGKNLPLKST